MKLAFRIVGWAMLFLLSIQLLVEFSGIEMFDTALFSLGGQSVTLQAYSEIIDIAPRTVAIIYIVAVLINVFSAYKKIDYIAVNLINAVMGILLLIVYAPALKDYFPFGDVEWNVPFIYFFIIWAYLSIIFAITEIIWVFWKKHKYHLKESTK